MARGVTIALVIILAAVAASANADEYNLYRPEKVRTMEVPVPGDGVLTRTIVIQRGDTLAKLSRRHSGRSSFFPQILLFNGIKNPDLIYAGKTLRVPLTRRGAVAAEEPILNSRPVAVKKRVPFTRKATGISGKQLFNRGVTAYSRGRYNEAIEIFDSYLTAYPNSADAPEAALYKAECYMKLSGR